MLHSNSNQSISSTDLPLNTIHALTIILLALY